MDSLSAVSISLCPPLGLGRPNSNPSRNVKHVLVFTLGYRAWEGEVADAEFLDRSWSAPPPSLKACVWCSIAEVIVPLLAWVYPSIEGGNSEGSSRGTNESTDR